MIYSKKKSQGFSLVELAIVMVILGFLIGGLLKPLGRQIQASQMMATHKALDEYKTALLGFALMNGRLPCPDVDGDGLEDKVTGGANCPAIECQASGGEPAWATLGASREDAWGQAFIYHVSDRFAYDSLTCADPCATTPSTNVAFQLCSRGTIQVSEGNDGIYNDTTKVAIDLPVIILSKGLNRGTNMPDENENMDGDTQFVKRKFNEVPAQAFNDLVVWISTPVLISEWFTK